MKKPLKIVICIALAAGGASGGYGIYRNAHKSSQADVSAPEPTPSASADTKQKKVKIPSYMAAGTISSESVEKDLTLLLTDSDGNKITDVAYKVKLVPEDQKDKLNESVKEITDVDQKIADAEKDGSESKLYTEEKKGKQKKQTAASPDEKKTAEKASEKQKTGKDEVIAVHQDGSEKPMTVGDHLLVEKQDALKKYGKVLDELKGDTYTDDDKDGMIQIDEIDSGKYEACVVPENDMDVSSFVNDVEVKDKIEYKPIENIDEKTVSAAEAGDTQPHQATTTESIPQDTVAWMNSSSEEKTEYVPTGEVPTVAASKQGNTITLYGNVNADSVTFPSTASVSDVTGDISASADGTGITVSAEANSPDQSGSVTLSDGTVCSVNVIGSGNPLNASNGAALYKDQNGTVYTVGDAGLYSTLYAAQTRTVYHGWQTMNGNRYYYDGNGNAVTGDQVIQGVKYRFGSDGTLLKNGNGIDVSQWQGSIDWSQASQAVSFAIVRVGFRGSVSRKLAVDPYAVNNIVNARANGVTTGAYFYSTARNEREAVEEASLAVETVNQAGGVAMPIYIDMEDDAQASLSNAQRTAIINAFASTVRAAGYTPGVYANKNWLDNLINTGSLNCRVWVAQWNNVCTYSGSYNCWQYSSNGTIPGISGRVDLDISY